jgi:polyisoprenoid-binding protein YceI
MLRIASLFLLLSLVLAACTSAPTPTPVPPTAAPTKPAATNTPSPVALAVPTPTSAPMSGGTKVDPKSTGVFYTFQVISDQSEVSYAVQELFFGRPAPQTTVGTTKISEGQFVAGLNGGKLIMQSNKFKVDLRTLKSDNPVRDQAIQRGWLESNKYPFAEFTSTSIDGLPAELKKGVETAFKVTGNMTIREITKPVTFDAKATLSNDDTLTGSATLFLLMKDFGFSAPDIAGRLTVTDGVMLTVKGVAKLTEPKQ